MNWQEQVGKCGCGPACLAMLTDSTYARVMEAASWMCDAKCGVDEDAMFAYLADEGYAVQKLERRLLSSAGWRTPWPPKPWAPSHLVLLWQTKTDWQKDDNGRYCEWSHYIVMNDRGVCFDPADAEHVRRRLKDYYRVAFVAGVWPAS